MREAMRSRVKGALDYRLTLYRLKIPDSPSLLEHDLDQLAFFVAIGALTNEEAERWRERLTFAAEAFRAPDGEVVGEDVRSQARELLSEALAAYRASNPDAEERPRWRFGTVLGAFKAVGAVSEDEASNWDRKFHEVLERRSKPKREARQRAQRKSGREASRYNAAELARLVLGPPQRLSGVRVTCAELYGDCVIVRWHRVLSAEEIHRGEKSCSKQPTADEVAANFGAAFSLEDDLGTNYTPGTPANQITGDQGLSENHQPVPIWGRSVFVPTVPRRATHLRALNGNDEFHLSLS